MAFVSLRQVLDHAAEHGYGVPAFNVNNLEQIIAIMEAAQETVDFLYAHQDAIHSASPPVGVCAAEARGRER